MGIFVQREERGREAGREGGREREREREKERERKKDKLPLQVQLNKRKIETLTEDTVLNSVPG